MIVRPNWYHYFLSIASVVSLRATCLRRRYGAIIVKNTTIISTGYNGAPRGEPNCIDTGCCIRELKNIPSGERYELCRAVHAEQNAILNAGIERTEGGTIYISGFDAKTGARVESKPCKLCWRMIQNAKISNIIYYTANEDIVIYNVADKNGILCSLSASGETITKKNDISGSLEEEITIL